MTLYCLVDRRLPARRALDQVIELYGSREDAEQMLREVLHDEPTWAHALSVYELPLVECLITQPSPN